MNKKETMQIEKMAEIYGVHFLEIPGVSEFNSIWKRAAMKIYLQLFSKSWSVPIDVRFIGFSDSTSIYVKTFTYQLQGVEIRLPFDMSGAVVDFRPQNHL